jgi:hypothetical protein
MAQRIQGHVKRPGVGQFAGIQASATVATIPLWLAFLMKPAQREIIVIPGNRDLEPACAVEVRLGDRSLQQS